MIDEPVMNTHRGGEGRACDDCEALATVQYVAAINSRRRYYACDEHNMPKGSVGL